MGSFRLAELQVLGTLKLGIAQGMAAIQRGKTSKYLLILVRFLKISNVLLSIPLTKVGITPF